MCEERRRGEADDDEGDDPTEHSFTDDEPVDALAAFEQGDTDGGTNLAVSGRQRPAETGSHDDDASRTKLDADTATRGELGNLGTESVKNLVAVQGEATDDAGGAKSENPIRIVAHVSVLINLAALEDDYHRGEGTDRVGHIVGAVRERVAARGEDLQVSHAKFSLFVKLFGVFVDRQNSHVFVEDVFSLVAERRFEMILESVPQATRRAKDTDRVCARLTDNLLFSLLARTTLRLFELLLLKELIRRPEDVRGDEEVRKNAASSANAERDGARRANWCVVELKELGALVHDEEDVDDECAPEQHRECDGSSSIRMFGTHDEGTQGHEEDERKGARDDRGQEPGDDDGDDAFDVREIGRFRGPNDTIATTRDQRHSNHTPNARVRRGDGHFEGGGDDEPDGDGKNDAQAAVHQETGIVRTACTGEAFLVSNALANRLDDVTAHEHGTTEFKDRGENYGVFNGQRARPDRGGERIRDVVSTCR